MATADTAPVTEWFRAHGAEIGPVGAVLALQIFVLLVAVNGSPLLGVSLAADVPVFTTEIVLTFTALFLLYGPPLTRSQRAARAASSVLEGGSYESFLRNYGAGIFAVIGITSLLHYLGTGPTYAAGGTSVLTNLIFYGVYVGPTETLLFVIALPAALPRAFWWLGAGLLFALFHLPVDAATYGTGSIAELAYGFAFRFAFGCGLYLVYAGVRSLKLPGAGPGAAMSLHTAYDLWVAGALLPVPLALFHLSGVFAA